MTTLYSMVCARSLGFSFRIESPLTLRKCITYYIACFTEIFPQRTFRRLNLHMYVLRMLTANCIRLLNRCFILKCYTNRNVVLLCICSFSSFNQKYYIHCISLIKIVSSVCCVQSVHNKIEFYVCGRIENLLS